MPRIFSALFVFLTLIVFPHQSLAFDVGGQVLFQNCAGAPSPVDGVTVSGAGMNAVTDLNGEFTMTGIPDGDYVFTFTKTGFRIDSVTIRVASANATGLVFQAFEEVITPIANPTYALWNGFLGLTNILELVNRGDTLLSGTVDLYDITGTFVSSTPFSIEPFGTSIADAAGRPIGQFDLVLNTIGGFIADSYGVIQINYTGELDGRLFYYKGPSFVSDLEFAFGLPFNTPSAGNTAVSFNTNRPSTAPNVILNWLSIVNLAPTGKSFDVIKYDFDGNEISRETVGVGSFGRVDMDGGHLLPGPDQLGLIRIEPADATAPYIALVIRYGAQTAAADSAFDFAFPLVAKTPETGQLWAPLSTRFGATNWFEVVNTTASPVSMNVNFFDSDGNTVFSETLNLAAFAQRHYFASGFLAADSIGLAGIAPTTSNAIIAQSMNYFQGSTSGRMKSMYGSQARPPLGPRQLGSYNLFIGMNNFLRVFNIDTSTVSFSNSTDNTGLFGAPTPVSVPPFGGTEFAIHDTSNNNTELDTYGVLSLESSCSSFFIAELIRQRNELGGELDFATPTEVR